MTATVDRPASWALVERAQAGDTDAFGELYRQYNRMVFARALARTGHRQVAEDIAGETWVRAMRAIDQVTWQGRDIAAWLTTIARHLVIDYYNSGWHRLESPAGEFHGSAEKYDQTPEGDPEAAAIAEVTGEELLAALQQLTTDQRRCIELRFLQEYSIAETATAMGKSIGAIKVLQQRAVHSLANRYATQQPDAIRRWVTTHHVPCKPVGPVPRTVLAACHHAHGDAA